MNYLAFKKFLASAGISTRRFGDQCGIGKTTVHRLAQPHQGGLTPKYVREITPALQRACQDHLTASGASADSIHLILSDIFGEEFTTSIITRATLTPDMLRFFGLMRDPFAAPRNASEVFLTKEMEHIKAVLDDAVRFQGFAALLAPVGAGKTIVKNLMMGPQPQVPGPRSETLSSPPYAGGVAAVSADGVVLSTNAQRSKGGAAALPIQNPKSKIQNQIVLTPSFPDTSRITAAGIVNYILESFQIKPRRSLVLAQKQLEDHLAKLTGPVALCFDECHRLSDTTLTALKNFYELGTGGFQRYLGLVLFGQPQFETRLQLPRFREIAERLAVHRLAPFCAEDTENFLDHCLTKAVPSGPLNSGPAPANGAFAPTREGAPTLSDFGFSILDFGLEYNDDDVSQMRKHQVNSPNSVNSVNFFSPCAIRAIASRAATPLAVANLASAGMIEAYRMGERQVLARFIPEDRGPRAMRV